METLSGAALDIPGWVQRGRGPVRHVAAVCSYRGQRFAVRLLAVRLPPQAAREARVRALRRAQQHSRRVRAETLRMAEWVLVVTTLDEATLPTTAGARLYRACWQVELLFKRWKSLLQLDDLRVRTRAAVEAVVRLKLLAAEGEALPGPILRIGNTNSRLRFKDGPAEFMDRWCAEGPTHHVALGVGHQARKLHKLARLLDLELVVLA